MRKTIYLVLILALLAAALTSCAGRSQDIISGEGTVIFVELEGGFYGIITRDGERYRPVNLKQEYQDDELRILFKARVLKDVVSIHMWGTPVEIVEVKRVR